MKNRNPIARNAWKFNKPKVIRDKTKYSRKAKHKKSLGE